MTKWGVRSMVWYIFILIIAFCILLFNYMKFINNPNVQRIFFN